MNKIGRKAPYHAVSGCYKLFPEIGMLALMRQGPAKFDPAGAGIVLATVTVSCIGVGALIGWGAGNVGYGVLCGAIAGVPAGVGAVYWQYRESL